MLKTHQRLRNSQDISNVYKYGKRYIAPHGVFFVYKKHKSLNKSTRCAVIVGKRFSQKAVVRNRARRVLQASAQTIFKEHPLGYDIIIGYTKGMQMVLYKEAQEDLKFFCANLCKGY